MRIRKSSSGGLLPRIPSLTSVNGALLASTDAAYPDMRRAYEHDAARQGASASFLFFVFGLGDFQGFFCIYAGVSSIVVVRGAM